MNQMTISADVIAGSFLSDSELSLPEHPCVPPEILMIPYGASGFLFEGVDGTQVFSGRGARSFMPRLVTLLDGTRTLAEICAALPRVPAPTVFGALTLLYSRGLIADGPIGEAAGRRDGQTETARFLGRYIDATRVNRNRHEALDRLARARVVLAGAEAGPLAEALAGAGFGSLRHLARPDELDPESELLVTFFTDADTAPQRWLATAWEMGLRVLHAHLGQDAVEIGPLFVPGKSASPTCFRRLRADPPRGRAADPAFWAGVVAMQAQSLLSRIGRVDLWNACHVHAEHPAGKHYEKLALARLPGSREAGLGHIGAPEGDPENIVWRLHNAANGMPPRDLLVPRDHQMHYSAANMMSAQDNPEPHHGATPIPLPEARPLAVADRDGRLDLATLATLLRHAVGYSATGRRIAPSAGGLGSANVYLSARNVAGLPKGALCHYYAAAHRLDYLGVVTDEELSGALGVPGEALPKVVLLGVSDTEKTQKKYNNFAYRFAHLDCGVALGYLTDLAGSFGLPMRLYPELRDRSIAALFGFGTRAGQTIVSWAAGLGDDRNPARQPLPALRPHHAVTQLIELSAQHDRQVAPRPGLVPPAPAWAAGARPEEILATRRSVRSFAPAALMEAEVRGIVSVAEETCRMLDAAGALPVGLHFFGLVRNGTGLADIVVPSPNGFRRLAADVTAQRLAELTIQPQLVQAPFVLLVTGDFHDAVDRFGARGYRELIGRAGAVAARTLISAWADGIAGCPWGGLCESGWGALLGIDRYTRCPLFGISFGRTEARDD